MTAPGLLAQAEALAARHSRDRWQVTVWESGGEMCIQVGRDGVFIGPVHPRASSPDGVKAAILGAMAQIDRALVCAP
jgi:hypothetical protein